MARKKGARPYTDEQKQAVLRRVQGGESQVAIVVETGIPLATIGYWVRKAKGGAKAGRKPGRPRGTGSGAREEIAWALNGDVLVVRIPLRHFARQLAEKALARI